GAKGIGRFALDRLGLNTEMWTLSKNAENNIGVYWQMNWSQFDDLEKSISEIEAEISEIPIHIEAKIQELLGNKFNLLDLTDIDFKNGTILKISNLKDEWYTDEIENVFQSLEALIPPKELN